MQHKGVIGCTRLTLSVYSGPLLRSLMPTKHNPRSALTHVIDALSSKLDKMEVFFALLRPVCQPALTTSVPHAVLNPRQCGPSSRLRMRDERDLPIGMDGPDD